MTDEETIVLHDTVIGGQPQADDFTVTWRGLPVGRIMKIIGKNSQGRRWWWGCNVDGQLSLDGDSGTGTDLEDCIAKFMTAWARIHAGLTEHNIAKKKHGPSPR